MTSLTLDRVPDAPAHRPPPPELGTRSVFDATDAELDAHPHDYVRRMREHTDIWCRKVQAVGREIGVYTVFDHASCAALLNHPNTRQFYTELLMWRGVPVGPLQNLFVNGMPTVDGDAHRRRRKPLASSFTMPVIKRLQPEIRRFVRSQLQAYLPQGGMNLATEFAKAFPPRLLCSIIGIPQDEVDYFVGLARQAAVGLTLFPLDELPVIDGAAATLMDYVERLLGEGRAGERSDFLNHYLQLAKAGDPSLTDAEIYVQIIDLMLASAETTRMTITNAVSLLLSDRPQWEALIADRALVAGAVNEALRFEPSVGTCPRFTAGEIQLGETLIPPFSIISASLLGALRDPLLFKEPGRFNIRRDDFQRKHLVFGGGAHRCLGESLAWIEIFETIDAIADFMPQVHLTDGPVNCTGFSGMRKVSDCAIAY